MGMKIETKPVEAQAIYPAVLNVTQNRDPMNGLGSVNLVLQFTNRLLEPMKFWFERVEANGVLVPNVMIGGETSPGGIITIQLPPIILPKWRPGDPATVTFGYDVVYGRPTESYARRHVRKGVIDIKSASNVAVDFSVNTDEAL